MIEFTTFELVALLWAVLATIAAGYYRSEASNRGYLLRGATQLFDAMLHDESIYVKLREDFERSGASDVSIGD